MGTSKAAVILAFALLPGCIFQSKYSGDPPDPDLPPDCGDTWTPTKGELGLLEFTYDYGAIGCLFGCSANQPIAERAHVQIAAHGDVELPPVTVQSDAPDVATFEIGEDGDVLVETHAPGTVRLEIHHGETGELLEALALTVKPVTSIESEETDRGILVMQGGDVLVPVELLDERGCQLVGIGGVDYALEGGISESQVTLVDALAAWLFEPIFGSTVTEQVSIEALALGSGSVAVRAPSGAVFDFAIAVVDAGVVDRVSLRAEDDMTTGSSYSVSAQAVTVDDVEVHSPDCSWTLAPITGAVELSSTDRDMAFVSATAPGDATVSCSVGTAIGELAVTFR